MIDKLYESRLTHHVASMKGWVGKRASGTDCILTKRTPLEGVVEGETTTTSATCHTLYSTALI